MGVAVLPALAIASAVAGLGGTIVSMGAARSQASEEAAAAQQEATAQAQAANYQAQVAENNQTIAQQNAKYAQQAADAQAQQQMMKNREQEGMIRAAGAASGLDINSGSMEQLQQGQSLVGNLNVATIRNQGARAAYGYETQANDFGANAALLKQQAGYDIQAGQTKARAAQAAGSAKAMSSLLSGATSITGNLANYYKTGVFGGNSGGSTIGQVGA